MKNRNTANNNAVKSKPPNKNNGFLKKLFQKLTGERYIPESAQESIPYREMYRDGICRVTSRLYNKTIRFEDINYQLEQTDDQSRIFDGWCNFLNYFDSSVSVQLSFINKFGNARDLKRSVTISDQNDNFDSIRREFTGMLENQISKGNNGLVKTKYITFGIEADNLKTAKQRLERIEIDILSNFKALGVNAYSLSGEERLEVLHGQFHPSSDEKFWFDWDAIPKTGMTTKDYIAPTSFDFSGGKSFRTGSSAGAVSFVQILASGLTDRLLTDFLEIDAAVAVNLHIRSIDQAEAIKSIKRKLSDLDKMRIEEVRPDRALCEVA